MVLLLLKNYHIFVGVVGYGDTLAIKGKIISIINITIIMEENINQHYYNKNFDIFVFINFIPEYNQYIDYFIQHLNNNNKNCKIYQINDTTNLKNFQSELHKIRLENLSSNLMVFLSGYGSNDHFYLKEKKENDSDSDVLISFNFLYNELTNFKNNDCVVVIFSTVIVIVNDKTKLKIINQQQNNEIIDLVHFRLNIYGKCDEYVLLQLLFQMFSKQQLYRDVYKTLSRKMNYEKYKDTETTLCCMSHTFTVVDDIIIPVLI